MPINFQALKEKLTSEAPDSYFENVKSKILSSPQDDFFQNLNNKILGIVPEFIKEKPPILDKSKIDNKAALESALKTIGNFAVDIARAIPRAGGSLTLEALRPFGSPEKFTPETGIEKFVFGEEPIESIQERIKLFPERAEQFGIDKEYAKKIAPIIIPMLTALDVTPFGAGQKKVGKETIKGLTKKLVDDVGPFGKILRGTKGMTAEDIMKTYPDIKLTRDVPATDIYGNKVKIPDGEVLTPYELKGNKVLLQD